MNWTQIELHKVKREIRCHGGTYDFKRKVLDSYGQDTGETETVTEGTSGIFHVSKGYIQRTVQDATVTHGKGQPFLFVLTEDCANVRPGDMVTVSGQLYRVCELNDIQHYGIVTDISLEAVLSGNTV